MSYFLSSYHTFVPVEKNYKQGRRFQNRNDFDTTLPSKPPRFKHIHLPNHSTLSPDAMKSLKDVVASQQSSGATAHQAPRAYASPSVRPNLMEPDGHITCCNNDTAFLNPSARPHTVLTPRSPTIPLLVRRISTSWAPRIRNRTQCPMFIPPRHGNDLLTAWPGKHSDAIRVLRLRKPKCRCYLAPRLRPDQACDLGGAVDGSKTCAGPRVVEVYAAVIRATTNGDETALPGAEGHSFNGSVECPFVLGGSLGKVEYGGGPVRDRVNRLTSWAFADIQYCRRAITARWIRLEHLFRFEKVAIVIIASTGEQLAIR